jgi:hypothetical protein
MCIGKQDSVCSNLVDVGSIDFSLRIETGNIAHPQIICQNKNDVGALLIPLCMAHQESKKKTTKNETLVDVLTHATSYCFFAIFILARQQTTP